jgi:F-type H+-transporting ATPase subunit a
VTNPRKGKRNVHHPVSILFHPINALLVLLLGQPPVRWQAALGIAGEQGVWLPDHVIMSVLVVLIIWLTLGLARRRYSVDRPSTLQQILELLLSSLRNMCDDVIGHHAGRRFVPFITALTFYIFVANAFGLIFFLQPPTANTSTTFALSITAFIYYNIVAVGHHGPLGWLRHFGGPVWWLAPLMMPVEIISHLARILSLALRLFGNIFGEHTATGIFFVLIPFVAPWAMMGLSIIGITIQTFIFIMLSAVYIQEAVAVEH